VSGDLGACVTMGRLLATQGLRPRWAKQIHIVPDNLSAHKTKAVEQFLEQNPKVRFRFTPT
jgi:transposase